MPPSVEFVQLYVQGIWYIGYAYCLVEQVASFTAQTSRGLLIFSQDELKISEPTGPFSFPSPKPWEDEFDPQDNGAIRPCAWDESGYRNRIPPSAFLFQPERNRYICPQGKLLRPQGRFAYKKKRGLVAYRYQAKSSDCAPCIRKPECCPENQSQGRGLIRRVENSAILEFRRKMASPEAQAQYRRRARVVEFCHAWIKSKLGLRQFHVRGLRKAATELLWACLTYNLQQWIRLTKLQANPAAT